MQLQLMPDLFLAARACFTCRLLVSGVYKIKTFSKRATSCNVVVIDQLVSRTTRRQVRFDHGNPHHRHTHAVGTGIATSAGRRSPPGERRQPEILQRQRLRWSARTATSCPASAATKRILVQARRQHQWPTQPTQQKRKRRKKSRSGTGSPEHQLQRISPAGQVRPPETGSRARNDGGSMKSSGIRRLFSIRRKVCVANACARSGAARCCALPGSAISGGSPPACQPPSIRPGASEPYEDTSGEPWAIPAWKGLGRC